MFKSYFCNNLDCDKRQMCPKAIENYDEDNAEAFYYSHFLNYMEDVPLKCE